MSLPVKSLNEAYNLADAVAVAQMGGKAVVVVDSSATAYALSMQYPAVTFRVL
jgi:hypothetical protein